MGISCLLTGGTGFCGRYVMEYLENLGYEVSNLTREEFEVGDWSKLDARPDVVLHFAWPRLQNIQSMEHLDFARKSCEFLYECSRRGVRAVNIGSHNEYGVKFEPAKEDMICEPIDTYGIAKLCVTGFAKTLGFNTLRLFAVYGEGGRNFKSVYESSNAYANPDNVKDFVPLKMVGKAVERIIHARHLFGEVINVTMGRQESALELVMKLGGTHHLEKFNQYPQRQYEPAYWLGHPEKMQRLLNINPVTEQMIEERLQHEEENTETNVK